MAERAGREAFWTPLGKVYHRRKDCPSLQKGWGRRSGRSVQSGEIPTRLLRYPCRYCAPLEEQPIWLQPHPPTRK